MPKAEPARPVKPIPAERIQGGSPWRLERFSERNEREAQALSEQVLARMREELRPQLEAELEEIRRKAHEQAYKEGYEAGHAEGLEEGRRHAEAELAEARTELEQSFHRLADPLLGQLTHPLEAWEPELVEAMAQVLEAALRRFLSDDAEARARLFSRLVEQQLAEWQARSVPVTITVSNEDAEWAEELLKDRLDVVMQVDDSLPAGQVRLRQEHSLAELDWQKAIESFSSALDEALTRHDPSPSDSETAAASEQA
ncbi:FliH/SctL family protein [Sulfurivirga sp.]|uniref:FliH/SctL family protein n=1 Tax=Sulfurivirga sp. TaxID=2614236 RepID=UPI0025FE33CB|nr:FliH/SctL family protein [Sulfurivirga sp.]